MHGFFIAIVYRYYAGWKVEGATSVQPNVVSYTNTVGQKKCYIVGAYVPPNDQPTVNQVGQNLACVPEGVEALLASDLSAYLLQPREQQ